MHLLKRYLKGSYTVEAALIFPIVLYVLLFIIYSAFYLNNCMVLEEAAYETALYGTTLERKDVSMMKQKMQKKYSDAVGGRVIAMSRPSCSIEVKDGYVTVQISGTMHTISSGFLPGYNGMVLSSQKKAELWNPMDKIRLNKLLDKGN